MRVDRFSGFEVPTWEPAITWWRSSAGSGSVGVRTRLGWRRGRRGTRARSQAWSQRLSAARFPLVEGGARCGERSAPDVRHTPAGSEPHQAGVPEGPGIRKSTAAADRSAGPAWAAIARPAPASGSVRGSGSGCTRAGQGSGRGHTPPAAPAEARRMPRAGTSKRPATGRTRSGWSGRRVPRAMPGQRRRKTD